MNATLVKGNNDLQILFKFVKGAIKHEEMGYMLLQ